MRRPLLLLLPFALIACSPASAPADAPPAAPAPAAAATPPASAAPADPDATLGAYHWDLVDAAGADGARLDALLDDAGKPLRLDFRAGGVSVSNACNRMSASTTRTGDRLEIAAAVSTQMACVDTRLMTLEREIGQRLPGTHTLAIAPGEAPRLTLTGADGDVLTFAGTPTPATRYGSDGTQVFLEVAPQRVACNHPLIPDHRCLQVREVAYGDDGVQTTTGDWEPLYQDIDGYTHEPGVRNVLRLQRFEVRDPPADAPSVAYVLDTVIESETVAP
ncbi:MULTISPECIES: META and DUF4377 domain-containing protein [Luteimonas]|uniref:META and DUF4377 domain-containing protein n=1 Tax=Luteimonas TaxID=83614 RepID=UPI000C7A0A6B|nr:MULTISPECIES: META and DUF4377 domain-containing protein [Luteimonas]